MTRVFRGKLWSDLWHLKPFNLVNNGSHSSFSWFVSRWHFHNHWKRRQAVSISRLVRSRDAPTHAHKESFLSDLTQTLFIPSFLFSIFLPAACLHVSPCSDSHSFNSMIPLPKTYSMLIHPFLFFTPSKTPFLCIWLTEGFIQPGEEHITPLTDGREVWEGPCPPPRVCTSDCAPAVRQCSAMWTQARAGTSSLTPGCLIH